MALVDKELVEAKFFSAGFNGMSHQVDSGGGDKSRNLHLYFQVRLMMVQAARGLKGVEHVGLIWDKVTMVAVSFFGGCRGSCAGCPGYRRKING